MLTLLGKELRMLRISRGEILKSMADKLSITPAYLSAIENGKREPTRKFMNTLFSVYDLSDEEIEKLEKAYSETTNNVNIAFTEEMSSAQKDLSFVFARRFDKLSEEDVSDIMKILNKEASSTT